MRRCIGFVMVVLICVTNPKQIHAVSLKIDSYPQTITEKEFSIQVTVTGAKPATNYFKVLVYKENTHSYKSKTWNGSAWYDGSDGKGYFPVPVSKVDSTFELKAQLDDSLSGQYQLSVKRFTASGNSADDTATTVVTTIQLQTLAPTPSPPPQTPSPTPVQTAIPTSSPEAVELPTQAVSLLETVHEPEVVLAAETMTPLVIVASTSSAEEKQILEAETHTSVFLTFLYVMVGLAGVSSILFGVFLIWKKVAAWYTK